jgi:hypothetical protein
MYFIVATSVASSYGANGIKHLQISEHGWQMSLGRTTQVMRHAIIEN